jgi:hypothetical protein
MTEPVPETLDWVTIRGTCSVEHLFRLLAETVDSDVKVMQERLNGSGLLLDCQTVSRSKVVVSKMNIASGITSGPNVVFEFTRAGITAQTNPEGKRLFLAKPSFSATTGKCKLEIDGHLLELWQVSRRALEDLFFS